VSTENGGTFMLDLHTHTQASDGELTAEELWSCYAGKGIGLGISDHIFRGSLSTDDGVRTYLTQLDCLPVYRGYEVDLGCVQVLSDKLEDHFQYRILSAHSVKLPDKTVYSLEPYFAYCADAIGTFHNAFHIDTAKRVLEQLLTDYESDLCRRPVEILGHCTATPFHDILSDDLFLDEWEDALLTLCKKYQAALEISELWHGPGLRMVLKAVKRHIKLSCGSDCHRGKAAANFHYVTGIIQQAELNRTEFFYHP